MSKEPLQQVGSSLRSALREIVFGVEDGLISIFGLVIGVAAGTDSSLVVLLAGAAGAISSAVSMSAGTYLSVKSEGAQARKELEDEAERIKNHPEEEEEEVIEFLRRRNFTEEEIVVIRQAVCRHPDILLEFMSAHELRLGRSEQAEPLGRAAWMFVADFLAALLPVIPFALFPFAQARLISMTATVAALVALGVGRGLVTRQGVVGATVETLAVAGLAAMAGFGVGQLISWWAGVHVPV